MLTAPTNPPIQILRGAAALGGIALVASLAAAALCVLAGRPDQAMLAGGTAAGCWIAAVAGLLPASWGALKSPDGVGVGFLWGMALRGPLALGVLGLLVLLTGHPSSTVGGWVAFWYVLLLAAEAAFLNRQLRCGEEAAR